MRKIVLLAAPLLLAACASQTYEWAKPGAGDAEVSAAIAECRAYADQKTIATGNPRYSGYIRSYGGIGPGQGYRGSVVERTVANDVAREYRAFYASCMAEKGFERKPIAPVRGGG